MEPIREEDQKEEVEVRDKLDKLELRPEGRKAASDGRHDEKSPSTASDSRSRGRKNSDNSAKQKPATFNEIRGAYDLTSSDDEDGEEEEKDSVGESPSWGARRRCPLIKVSSMEPVQTPKTKLTKHHSMPLQMKTNFLVPTAKRMADAFKFEGRGGKKI